MVNITRIVWDIIKSDFAIQKDLSRKVINARALARHILKKYNVKASQDAVISAIRRFEGKKQFREKEKQLLELFRGSLIKTKTNIACLTLEHEAFREIRKIMESSLNDDFIRITTGDKQFKLMLDEKDLPIASKFISQKHIFKIKKGLGELSILCKEEIIPEKGVLARLANEISLQDINIEEIIVCPPEFLIYISQEDIVKTYESILKLVNKGP